MMAYSMERWIGKVAIVTGGSMGIGYAITEQLVNEGVTVVAVARGQEKLDEASKKLLSRKGKLFTYKADIGKEEDIFGLFKWVKENVGPVHILVNNAAVYAPTKLTEGDTKKWRQVFDVQVIGLCIATQEAVKDMRSNNVDGHIIHINSVDGHTVFNFPDVGVIPASKFAVTALTETLKNEFNLFKDKIKVSSISPGFVNTDGVQNMFQELKKTLAPEIIQECLNYPTLQPEDIARAIIFILSTPPHVQIHELMIKPIGEPF